MGSARFEGFVFRRRGLVLGAIAAITVTAGALTGRLVLDTALASHLPADHEFVRTLLEHQDELLGSDRVVVVLRSRREDIFSVSGIRKLKAVHDALAALPGIDRRTVTSLWSPGMTVLELDEEGLRTESVVGADFTADTLTGDEVRRIRARVIEGGYEGRLVSSDHTAAMLVANATDADPETGAAPEPTRLAARLDHELRQRFTDDDTAIHLLGFAPMIGEIAAGARTAFGVLLPAAVTLCGLLLWIWSGSWRLTLLALGCSGVSLVWELGFLAAIGRGLDPLAIPIPCLVFAVGTAFAVPQARILAARRSAGDDAIAAARAAFRGLWGPGAAALLVAAAACAGLAWIPIRATQTLGAVAAFGLAAKVATSLVLLPLLASLAPIARGLPRAPSAVQRLTARIAGACGGPVRTGPAAVAIAVGALSALASLQLLDRRHFGDEHPGLTELRPSARTNRDAAAVTSRFDFGLDLFTLVAETAPEACVDYEVMHHLDRASWHMRNVKGVQSVMAAPLVAKFLESLWNEGNPRWIALPRNRYALMQATSSIPAALGLFNADCSLLPIQVFTSDHRDATVRRVAAAARAFRAANPSDRVTLRLAGGGIAVQAATAEALAWSEPRSWGVAALAAFALSGLVLRDWRGGIACGAVLGLGALLGYALLVGVGAGLTPATLSALVLASGLAAIPACLLWGSLTRELATGASCLEARRRALRGAGADALWIGLGLAFAMTPWTFSALSGQFESGRLLVVLLLLHPLLASVLLPPLAALLAAPSTAAARSET